MHKNYKLQIRNNELQTSYNKLKISHNDLQISKNKLSQILIDRVHNYINHDAMTVEKAIVTIERLGGDVDNWLDEIKNHFYPLDYAQDYDPDDHLD
jgi:hypothetical protein